MDAITLAQRVEELAAENARLKERVRELECMTIAQAGALRTKDVEHLRECSGYKARLAQAEGLLRSKADRLKIPCGNNWIPDPDVDAFLHSEQEKPCNS